MNKIDWTALDRISSELEQAKHQLNRIDSDVKRHIELLNSVSPYIRISRMLNLGLAIVGTLGITALAFIIAAILM